MESNERNEFYINPFAEHYEAISDTFIDMKVVTASLKSLIPSGSLIFEIGLGTGYFASHFSNFGWSVEGIQPADEMLPILKKKHPKIVIKAECGLEDFSFDRSYDFIVSHSSVFLFTKHESPFGNQGEVLESLVFQSFVKDRNQVQNCILKTLKALKPMGQLFINIQSNPLVSTVVQAGADILTFDMPSCRYLMDFEIVEKVFRLSFKNQIFNVKDQRFCQTFGWFSAQIGQIGYKATLSPDRLWVIVGRTD